MRVCMITPHLPPEQAANALLPRQLGEALAAHGVTTCYVTHPPAGPATRSTRADDVVYVGRRGRDGLERTRAGALVAGCRMALGALAQIRSSDLVHLHGNGLIIEIGRFLADRCHKPYVITLYGTDVWHYDPVRHARFGSVVRGAACRVFYSHGLLDFAARLQIAPAPSIVIYAPVSSTFHAVESAGRLALRRELDLGDGPLLLTVKRLHDVAGYDVLLKALPLVLRERSDLRLWIGGEGELRSTLEAQARDLGLASRVRFLGMLDNTTLWRYYAAADVFVLPSRLESWGTVMLEALACGTQVIATDTAGALEVHQHFPDDVTLVARENPTKLAEAVCAAIAREKRTGEATLRRLQTEFTVSACAARYCDVYRQAIHAR